MSKPYFTPDPPPASNDVAELREWLVRQIERISDWWPQDLQTRVEALEVLSRAVSGTWPIIDFSTVQFTGAYTIDIVAANAGFISQGNSFSILSSNFESVTVVNVPGLNNGFEFIWTDNAGRYYAYGDNKFWYSINNGISWTSYQLAHLTFGVGGLGYSNGFWYAFGHGTTSQSAGLWVWKSSDFISWSIIYSTNTGPSPSASSYAVATNKNGTWLLDSATPDVVLVSDDDGVTWSQVTAANSRFTRIANYAGDIWFLTGSRDTIITSTDLLNWTTRSFNSANLNTMMHSVTYADGVWRAVNGSGVCELWGSSNGTNWTRISATYACTNPRNRALIYKDGYGWLGGGQNNSGAFDLGKSIDGSTFVAVDPTNYTPGDVVGVFLTELISG